ncbi:hypothetical protein B0A52_03360 [Exophiala mesophila]|uniref:Uncharacterized protein n=1 Tax=Exophiala mesophila TaxID=212818 RepID=A0A438NBJ5_EXOME|nr:hypothetical protein B0A52_03360 [Exophiala mesophila]
MSTRKLSKAKDRKSYLKQPIRDPRSDSSSIKDDSSTIRSSVEKAPIKRPEGGPLNSHPPDRPPYWDASRRKQTGGVNDDKQA